jgi:outer membrane protein OmpA-like peptidoglycan-associated protein
MRLVATRILTWYSLFLLALLGTPGAAHAQPVDDPGLQEAPPPPPKPTTPPPPATAPSPLTPGASPAPATPAPPKSTFTVAPAPLVTAQPEVSETVDVKTEWVAPDPKDKARAVAEGDLYDRVAAPTLFGGVGLLRTLTGDSGRSNSFRIGLHIGGFQQDSFLVSGSGVTPGDTNSHFKGGLTVSYTPWKYIEAYFAIFNSSNKNTRTDAGRTDPEVILALGDLGLGLKGRYPVARFIDLAIHLGIKLLNGVSGISFDGDSTNVSVDAIASFDLRHAKATEKVPLRFHLNFGYLHDNSLSLLPQGQCAASTGNVPCIRSRVVETFAYGIGTSRLRVALAVDAPVLLPGNVGLQPFFEYHVEAPLGDGDQTVLRALRNDPRVSGDRLTGQSLQYLTFGFRVRPVAGLFLDTAIDIGLQSPGFQYGPPVPVWNLIGGIGYVVEPGVSVGKTKLVTKTITREVTRGAVEGKVRGVVRDAKTRKPLGAIVKYLNRRVSATATADDGTFTSPGLTPGDVQMEVSRDDYEPVKLDASVVGGGETPIDVMLTPKPPAAGQLRIKVSDNAGGPIGMATVRLSVAATGSVIDAEPESPGTFTAKLPGGDYTMDVLADGFLGKQRQVSISAGQVQTAEVVLTKKPAVSHVQIKGNEIILKGVIHFGTNNAELRPDSTQLLDEVADVLIKNPQIKRVRVEGHTDNRGIPEKNMQLSKARAASVVAYLVKQGIDQARLESEGYGATQPKVPNLTPAQRAVNRRVAFKILDTSAPVVP